MNKRLIWRMATGLVFILMMTAFAGDWPMWRYDAGRTANGPENLPGELHLLWARQYSEREPVWDDPLNQDMMQFDRVFEPVVLGNILFVGFNDRDKVAALDTDTGAEKWVFYTDGPVRLPAAAWNGKFYFVCDDGYLYCLSAGDGKLLWKIRGGPSDRKILGNRRLISTWPARGGPAIQEGIVYFAASIWPFMGTFLYAVDSETGETVWKNESTGSVYMNQPHNSPSFAGIAPQGIMTVSGEYLLIPGGRSVPANFNRLTGDMNYYHLAKQNKTGGAFVCADERHFFNHDRGRVVNLFDLKTGDIIERKIGKYPVMSGDIYYMSGDSIKVIHREHPRSVLQVMKVDASGDLIRSGSRLYAGGAGSIAALNIASDGMLEKAWKLNVEGTVGRLLAAGGKLFAVTEEGNIMAFGEKPGAGILRDKTVPWQPSRKNEMLARTILEQTEVTEGYALFYGAGDGEVLAALAQASNLNIVAVDPDPGRIESLRRRFDSAGLLGLRVHLLSGTPSEFPSPPYMASLTVCMDPVQGVMKETVLKKIVESVRPYGGKVWLPVQNKEQKSVTSLTEKLKDPMLSTAFFQNSVMLSREGPLPGAANWTHQYGDVSNTVKSDDRLVQLPLGVLWFGGNSNMDVLPRHGHGPPEQVVDGRLIIQGIDGMSARDVYTGRVLWTRELDSLGTFRQYFDETYDEEPLAGDQRHIPGANIRGTNYIASSDFIYVIQGSECHVLNITSGKTEKIFELPRKDASQKSDWSYIGLSGDHLIAGSGFVPFSTLYGPAIPEEERQKLSLKDLAKRQVFANFDYSSSQSLVIMDRHDGKVKWSIASRYGFIHNAITASEGTLFCLDKLPPAMEKMLSRRGLSAPSDYRLLALDIKTGKILWEKNEGIFGSWLSYSLEFDRLLQATRPSRDMVTDESGKRMSVFNAVNGELIWDKEIEYNNPPILHHENIITDNAAYSLASGEQKKRQDPLTGQTIPWTYSRSYGCNYHIASEYLLSFRSAAAGFYDLYQEGGTGNFGGFKSGCTSNLIAAGGVLNAPDYTRTCQCSYQNQTSLALIHMPEMEYWTTNNFAWNGMPVQKIGLNLFAPGDRVAGDGTLWLDYPSTGGESPDIVIKDHSKTARGIRKHSLSMKRSGYEWVAASGIAGLLDMDVRLSGEPDENARYTVKLHFAELEDKKPGQRVFNVLLQDEEVLTGLDVIHESGSSDKSVIKEISHVPVRDVLRIRCVPSREYPDSVPLLCGIELVKEK